MNSDKSDSKPKIKALIVLEVLGKPPEHLKKVLEGMSEKMAEEKGIAVKTKKINEPKELEKKKGFYTNFAEIEVEADNINLISGIMFKYMPAHVEILSPENISLQNNDFTMLFNELTRRLHGYDEIARVLQAQKKMLEGKLREILEKAKKAGKLKLEPNQSKKSKQSEEPKKQSKKTDSKKQKKK